MTFSVVFRFDLYLAAQAVVSRATRSCGLPFQPQREGIFWTLLRRWHVSIVFLIRIVDLDRVMFAEAEGKKKEKI